MLPKALNSSALSSAPRARRSGSTRKLAGLLAHSTLLMSVMMGVGVNTASAGPEAQGSSATVRLAQNAPLQAAATVKSARPAPQPGFAKFAPKAQTKNTKINYDIWEEALKNVVLDLGPSLRQRAPRPLAKTGTRRVTGHTSAYRLEGSRVTFSYISDEYRRGLTEYRKELEQLSDKLDIQALSRDEQLSYWFNLHNVAVLEQISIAYPTERPRLIKIDVNGVKTPFQEAKFLTVKGQAMSLRDLREQIVYANWSNPEVIYGFYRGDIGSPKMSRFAYDSGSLEYTLQDNAEEFVNALRGFNLGYDTRNVSEIYAEARPYFFPNFDQDLENHLAAYADEDVLAEIRTPKPFKVEAYDNMVGDLSGGQRLASSGLALSGELSMSYETQRLLSEVRRKQETLIGRGEGPKKNLGWVVIEDIETQDPGAATPPPAPTPYVAPQNGSQPQ